MKSTDIVCRLLRLFASNQRQRFSAFDPERIYSAALSNSFQSNNSIPKRNVNTEIYAAMFALFPVTFNTF